jgi:hypothetical protein
MCNEDKEEKTMPVTEIKPIRPTTANYSKEDVQKFDNYATENKKTQSVGMNKMREMMREFREKRK